jgi:hypothetical protein
MSILYKLTDQNWRTQGKTEWGPGVTHSIDPELCGFHLCSKQVIHAYESPLVAAFMNPIHTDFNNPVLWEANGEIVARDGQLKCGTHELTTVRIIDLPIITNEQRVTIAIQCAKYVCADSARKAASAVWAVEAASGSDLARKAALAVWASSESWAAVFDLHDLILEEIK